MFLPKITKEKNCQYLLPVIKHTFKQKKNTQKHNPGKLVCHMNLKAFHYFKTFIMKTVVSMNVTDTA